jgi:CheY-like chemotaxis protein
MQRKVMVRTLLGLDDGWQINEAADSEQALVKLKAGRGNYNVIIVDESVGSDSLRGHEFVQFIRTMMNVTAFIIGIASEGSDNKKLLLRAGANIAW